MHSVNCVLKPPARLRLCHERLLDTLEGENFALCAALLNPLEAILRRLSADIDSKELTEKLNPLEATLTKN